MAPPKAGKDHIKAPRVARPHEQDRAIRPAKRAKLLPDDSASEESDTDGGGGVALNGDAPEPVFKINEEYAKRFEHNKKREELHRLEEKYGKNGRTKKRKTRDDEETGGSPSGSDGSSSESESEDDEGILATEALDAEISATLQAIRSKDPKVYDKSVTFYTQLEAAEELEAEATSKKEKPMFLSDYHRKNLLEGHTGAEDDEEPVPKSYVQEQEELKRSIVMELHAAADNDGPDDGDDGEGEDDFLVAKSRPQPVVTAQTRPKLAEADVAAADKDPETFLSNFLAARAWVPTTTARFQPFESDDEEEEKRAEAFEEAYNFRFEDPALANEKLLSHARDAAAKYSVRREELSGRKKQRETERMKKEEEKKEREEEKARLRKLKIEEMAEKVSRIKEAAGIRGKQVREEDWAGLLEEDWDDNRWEEEMNRRFGESYYAENEVLEDGDTDAEEAPKQKRKAPKKPKWDDDIDIKDLVPDFEETVTKPPFTLSDESEEEDAGVSLNTGASDLVMDDGLEAANEPKTKKDRLKEQAEKKRQARKERRKIEQLVDEQLELDFAVPTSSKKAGFRYRETSPQTYGLTAKDILIASDSQLNQFAGLKKLATFRDPAKKAKDRKKLGKKARLRQWRKETFGNPDGPTSELADVIAAQTNNGGTRPEVVRNGDAGVDIREGKKKRKRSRKNKDQATEA